MAASFKRMSASAFIRAAFVLHCPLVVLMKASNDECNLGPTSEVLALSRARECVEYDLETPARRCE